MSHNSRSFLPGEANREDPRKLHNTWRKFYEPDAPFPPPPPGAPYPFFTSSSGLSQAGRDWWGAPSSGSWQPPPAEADGRRFNFSAPPPGRGNVLPAAPRGYDPQYPDSRSVPNFSERPAWGASRGEGWPERPVTPFNDRPLGNDHWSPGAASSPSRSSARDRDRDWDRDSREIRGWSAPRRTASPSYSSRPLLEPSQAWKDRERQLSIEHSTTAVAGGSNMTDFQSRRFHQLPIPPPPPPPARTRYNDRFPTPAFPRRAVPHRRLQRISARISARPKREPSPSSSESSMRSRSRSIHSPRMRSAWERKTADPVEGPGTILSFKEASTSLLPDTGPSSASSSKFTFRSAYAPSQDAESPIRRQSPSPSCSGQSSIRSSVHSSPPLVSTELEPPTPHSTSAVPLDTNNSIVPGKDVSPSQEDTEFELPGMRFLKDGALKPGLEPPKLIEEVSLGPGSDDKAKPSENSQSTAGDDILIPRQDTKDTSGHLQLKVGDLSMEGSSNNLPPDHESPADHTIQPPQHESLYNNHGLAPALEQHAIVQTQDIILESPQLEVPDTESSTAVDQALAAPVSSPLSDLIPLSPPPDVPELQEDVDDFSSMSIDDDSSSTSSDSSPADDITTALRVFFKARDGKDLQTRSERFEPILRANHDIVDPPTTRINTSNEVLVREVLAHSLPTLLERHAAVSQSLLGRFRKQAEDLETHTRRLREEYKTYHDRWVADCRKLDHSMASSASQGVEGLPVPSGRVTRRSAALGDTVRSDLEMEQIIASLGNEDMTDPNVLAIRNTAIIPDLVSTDPFAINLSFDDDNGLVDDPAEFFDVYGSLGRWTDEEKQIFVEKYGIYPKQFGAIASFLPNKTPAQCVIFYYLHKKELVDFRSAISKYGPKRKRRGKAGKGKGNALLADIVKPTRSGADEDGTSHKHSDRFIKHSDLENGRLPNRRPFLGQDNAGEVSRALPTIVARGSRVSALQQGDDSSSNTEITRQISSRPVSVENSLQEKRTIIVPPAQDYYKRKVRIQYYTIEQTSEAEVTGEPSKKPKQAEKVKEKRPPGRPPKKSKERAKALEKAGGSLVAKSATSYVWNKGEEAMYLVLVARHGKDFEKIAGEMPAKTALQCRNYFRNHAKDLDLERIAQQSNNSMAPTGMASPKNSSASPSKDKKISEVHRLHISVNGGSDVGSSKISRARAANHRGKEEGANLSAPGMRWSHEPSKAKRLPSLSKDKETT